MGKESVGNRSQQDVSMNDFDDIILVEVEEDR
jgi:hypothetical protein